MQPPRSQHAAGRPVPRSCVAAVTAITTCGSRSSDTARKQQGRRHPTRLPTPAAHLAPRPPAVRREGDVQCEGAWRDKGFLRSSFCLSVAGRRLPVQGLAALPGAAAPATHPWGTQGCPALLPLPAACSCSSPSRAGDTHNLQGAQRASRAIVVLTFIYYEKKK